MLTALTAIERELAAVLRPGLDHQVAHVRLEWWRAEAERCRAGEAVHPATRALLAATPARRADFTGLTDTAVWDLACATFATRAELTAYCTRWAAGMFGPLLATGELGAAIREIELSAGLAADAHRGRIRVPLDELAAIGVEAAALATPPWPDTLCRLLRERQHGLREALAGARGALAAMPAPVQRSLRGLVVWAQLARRLSHRIEQTLPHPVRGRAWSAMADAWSSWRTARAVLRGVRSS